MAGHAFISYSHRDADYVKRLVVVGGAGSLEVAPGKRTSPVHVELDDEIWTHVCAVAKRIELALRRCGVRCEGINLFLADGEAASQTVPHIHLHVMPRFAGDSFKIAADWTARPSREELDQVAARVRDSYQQLWGG